jgi:3',5'-cyclic AMP phosphodiesterase CpdA
LAVPGNHDYYIPCAAASGHFERAFAAWQLGQRIGEFRYPFAQRVGPLWLVAVNSAIPHRWPTDASGSVGREQRERLRQLLNSLGPGPRILVTHYPIAQFNGQPQRPSHGLRDLAEILTIADAGGIALWLHGHDHRNYLLDDRRLAPFPIINAGSTTQLGTWGYNIYSITGWTLKSDRREFDSDLRAFRDGPGCEVALRHAP